MSLDLSKFTEFFVIQIGLDNLILFNVLFIYLFLVLLWFRYAKEVCDAIVAKCLTGRPKTVEKAQIAFMLWVELEAVEAFLVRVKFKMLCILSDII